MESLTETKVGNIMKIIIAIDSFKGSLSSIEASEAITSGMRAVDPDAEIVTLPLADGGEGTVAAFIQATGGKEITTNVTGPLGKKVEAVYGILTDEKTAVIEVAAACGLPLLAPEQQNPMVTTTHGVGELILSAIDRGCRNFIIGLGGSATTDAGVGMLQALGFRFLDNRNKDVGFGGKALRDIASIDTRQANPRLEACTFQLACDVTNPLYGSHGAATIFGPQKGASKSEINMLDQGLKHFAHVAWKELGKEIHALEGAGAAGGLGAAFSGFLDAELQSGSELIIEAIHLEDHLKNADLVITGEGKLDSQTAMGKGPIGVAKIAAKHHVPVIALAGAVTEEAAKLNELGITAFFPILSAPMSINEAMNPKTTYNHLKVTAGQILRLVKRVE